MSGRSLFSRIPAVDKLLSLVEAQEGTPSLPQLLITETVRQYLSELRSAAQSGKDPGELEAILREIETRLSSLASTRIQPVINGTGVIIHTNLGRSPLAPSAAQAVHEIAQSYSNLEFDLPSGARGSRGGYLEAILATLCGAESATVCNNCASALILILKHLANGERSEVIISRGELVEIGGGFRIPEIMETSGATLREVGATNKTSLRDYEKAIGPQTGMILKVHRSNFYMGGFVDEPSTEELVALGKEHDLPVIEDLGSGAMIATNDLAPIPHEPTSREALQRGIDLVCVSGDKLLGGPQAGLILGRKDLVQGIKKEPFFRALRCDKLVLTGLQATIESYLQSPSGELPNIPVPHMIAASPNDALLPRAKRLLRKLKDIPAHISCEESIARCGGGTMPQAEIPSISLSIAPKEMSVTKLARLLRGKTPPIIGYTADDHFHLDLRTIRPDQDSLVVESLQEILLSTDRKSNDVSP
ncbi:MAG: L-seryl-tRNA(Sec) selenium transferase [Verrucomicrobiota bacterium]